MAEPHTRMEREYVALKKRQSEERVRKALEAYDSGDRSDKVVMIEYYVRKRGGCHACNGQVIQPVDVTELLREPSRN